MSLDSRKHVQLSELPHNRAEHFAVSRRICIAQAAVSGQPRAASSAYNELGWVSYLPWLDVGRARGRTSLARLKNPNRAPAVARDRQRLLS